MRACQKLWNSPGFGECPAPGQRKIGKCSTPWTEKAGKYPAVARWEEAERSWNCRTDALTPKSSTR